MRQPNEAEKKKKKKKQKKITQMVFKTKFAKKPKNDLL